MISFTVIQTHVSWDQIAALPAESTVMHPMFYVSRYGKGERQRFFTTFFTLGREWSQYTQRKIFNKSSHTKDWIPCDIEGVVCPTLRLVAICMTFDGNCKMVLLLNRSTTSRMVFDSIPDWKVIALGAYRLLDTSAASHLRSARDRF